MTRTVVWFLDCEVGEPVGGERARAESGVRPKMTTETATIRSVWAAGMGHSRSSL